MANFTAAHVDLHQETHTYTTRNVADNRASALVEAAKKGILFCESHIGIWISKPGNLFGVTTRDCPICSQLCSAKLYSSSSSESATNGRRQDYDMANSTEYSKQSLPFVDTLPPSPYPSSSSNSTPTHQQNSLLSPISTHSSPDLIEPHTSNNNLATNNSIHQNHHNAVFTQQHSENLNLQLQTESAPVIGDALNTNNNEKITENELESVKYQPHEKIERNSVKLSSSSTESTHNAAKYNASSSGSPVRTADNQNTGKLHDDISSPSTGQKKFSYGVYNGELINGKACGRGILTFASGNRYEGDWKDDKMNGRGILIYSDGRRLEGVWENGNHKSS
mmetsp:Transcript_16532/g.22765  ORF Transcript_16532/g.22765 Transcript_16532/m.22765 type:complete len:336 (-) Transcript_16532:145-1152(-)